MAARDKLKPEQIEFIQTNPEGLGPTALASMFGVTNNTVGYHQRKVRKREAQIERTQDMVQNADNQISEREAFRHIQREMNLLVEKIDNDQAKWRRAKQQMAAIEKQFTFDYTLLMKLGEQQRDVTKRLQERFMAGRMLYGKPANDAAIRELLARRSTLKQQPVNVILDENDRPVESSLGPLTLVYDKTKPTS